MTQDERWVYMWQQYMNFMAVHHRCPSKYRPEERDLVNWLKHNRKRRNQHLLPDDRQEPLARLLATASRYRRVNQYKYKSGVASKSSDTGWLFADDDC